MSILNIHKSSSKGKLYRVQYLVDNGVSVNDHDLGGKTPLYHAAKHNQLPVVEYLLEKKADVNGRSVVDGGNTCTPLIAASCGGHTDIISCLLKYGAMINLADNDNSTALWSAASKGQFDSVFSLIAQKAQIHKADNMNITPLSIAAEFGYANIVICLAKAGAKVNTVDKYEQTPISVAAMNGHLDTVAFLCHFNANVNQGVNEGRTPLVLACLNNHFEVAHVLLKNGADANIVDSYGRSPLLIVLDQQLSINSELVSVPGYRQHIETISLLCNSKATVNTAAQDGSIPLHLAINRNHNEVVQILLKHGADVDTCDLNADTLLHVATQRGFQGIADLLLQNKANVNKQNNKGETPLFLAAKFAFIEIVNTLVENGADVNISDSSDRTPLLIAACGGVDIDDKDDLEEEELLKAISVCSPSKYLDIVKSLCKHGTEVNKSNDDGLSPLMAVCLLNICDIAECLVAHGADVNACDEEEGMTPLLWAAIGSTMQAKDEHHKDMYLDIVSFLCKNGANVNVTCEEHYTPLVTFCFGNNVDTVQHLIENGADIDTCEAGDTALHFCSMSGQKNTAQLLLQKEAKINEQNEEKETPLWIAAANGFSELVNILIANGADVNLCDGNNRSPLFAASSVGLCRENTYKEFQENLKIEKSTQEQYTETVKCLCRNGAGLNFPSEDGITPLMQACIINNPAMLQCLLELEANVDTCDKKGFTALHFASGSGQVAVVQLLLNHKAKIVKSKVGETPLELALQEGSPEDIGETPFDLAQKPLQEGDKEDIVKTPFDLSQKGLHEGDAGDIWETSFDLAETSHQKGDAEDIGETSLDLAQKALHEGDAGDIGETSFGQAPKAHQGDDAQNIGETHLDLAQKNLQEGEAEDILKTPIHLAQKALQEGDAEDIRKTLPDLEQKALEEGYAEDIGEPPFDLVQKTLQEGDAETIGETPLDLAPKPLQEGDTEDIGEPPFDLAQKALHKVDAENIGETPFDLAQKPLQEGDTDDIGEPPFDLAQKALHKVDAENIGETPFDLAQKPLQEGDTEEIGEPPFDIAQKTLQEGIVQNIGETQLLLQKKVNINEQNEEKQTPLWIAAANGFSELVNILIANGAIVNLCDSKNRSPLFAATSAGLCKENRNKQFQANLKIENSTQEQYIETVKCLCRNGAGLNLPSEDGITPLMQACITSNPVMLKCLLGLEADVKTYDKKGFTALHFASSSGHMAVVQLLLKHKDKIVKQKVGETTLELALQEGDTEDIVQTPLDLAQKALQEGDAEDIGETSFDLAQNAIEEGDAEDIGETHLDLAQKSLQEGDAEDIGESLLDLEQKALQEGDAEDIGESLLDLAQKSLQEGDAEDIRKSLLDLAQKALQEGNAENIRETQLLLEQKVNINEQNEGKQTPLWIAAANGFSELVNILIANGADVNLCDNNNRSPLFVATSAGLCRENINKQFQENLKIENSTQDQYIETVKCLCRNGAGLNLPSEDGITPLMQACIISNPDMLQCLLELEAHVDTCDTKGFTALHFASGSGQVAVVQLLLKHKAKIAKRKVGETFLDEGDPEEIGEPPFDIAQKAHQEGDAQDIGETQLLLQKKANINEQNEEKQTPLWIAAANGFSELVNILIANGADVNLCDNNNRSPLFAATSAGLCREYINKQFQEKLKIENSTQGQFRETVKCLCRNGAGLNLPSEDGITPLMQACITNNPAMLRCLLKLDADVETFNKKGFTALHLASGSGHIAVVKLLLKHKAKIVKSKVWKNSLNLALQEGEAEDIGETPLDLAQKVLWEGDAEDIDKTPLELAPKALQEGDAEDIGETPSDLAQKALQEDNAEDIGKTSLDLAQKALQEGDPEDIGKTPLDLVQKALQEGEAEDIDKTSLDLVQKALQEGDAEDIGKTSLHLAQKALQEGNAEDIGITPLDLAQKALQGGNAEDIGNTSLDLAQKVLQEGNAEDIGNTSLDLAQKALLEGNAEDIRETPLDLSQKLLQDGNAEDIGQTPLDLAQKALQECDAEDIAKIEDLKETIALLQSYKLNYKADKDSKSLMPEEKTDSNGVRKKIQPRKSRKDLSDKLLLKMAKAITSEWKLFGGVLGVAHATIRKLATEYKKEPVYAAWTMLVRWRDSTKGSAKKKMKRLLAAANQLGGNTDSSDEGSTDSSAEGSTDSSAEEGSTDSSDEEGSTDSSAAGGSTDSSAAGGSTDSSAAGGSTDSSAAGGSTDSSTAGGSTDSSSVGGNIGNIVRWMDSSDGCMEWGSDSS